ncbi:MAG TPA: polysaccharide biosynthesis/export family protein [Pyrinomonadaceae bacterium]|nr:polysaccharide biosynthesis/export family protein [Pyrinomonadaceae bacterium]
MYLRFLTVLVLAFPFAIAASGQSFPTNAVPQGGYLIGPGDEVTVKVLGESQFDFVSTVDENGKIEVPFVEAPIGAKCLSERDLRTEITKLLAKYLKTPQLNLHVDRKSRPPVSVYGEVRQQQQFSLTRRAYLLELLTVAGGESDKSGGMITVFRTRPPMCGEAALAADWKSTDGLGGPSKTFSVASLKQGVEGSNPEIFPGDVILVHKAAPIYITGEVVRPGELNIPEGGLLLTQAVAMANGITREAKTKNVTIRRRKSGSPEPELIAVNYDQIKKGQQKDILLEPFDIIVVDKAKKSIGDILLDTLTGLPNRIPIPL